MTVASELALITGASAGLGRELARCAAADGCNLLLIARRLDRLDALAAELRAAHGVDVRTCPVDLTVRAQLLDLCTAVETGALMPDILINNAGIGFAGRFSSQLPDELTRLLDLDMTAPALLLRACLPGMLARGRGRILNVASIAGFQPGPELAAYSAAKAFLLSLSLAASQELRGTGVHVTALCPGPVATEFAEVSGLAATRLFSGPLPVAEATMVARLGWAAMRRGQRRCIPGLAPRLITLLGRVTPEALGLPLSAYLLRPRRA